MRADFRRRLQHEEGMALGMVLIAMVILAGLSTVFVAASIAETTGTGSSRDFENAVHAAEAGAEALISQINVSPKNLYTQGPESLWTYPADEKQWALDVARGVKAADPTFSKVVKLPNGGWGYGVRPHLLVNGNQRGMNFIYGVGEVPGAKGPRTRVIKMQIDVGMYTVEHAVLSNGSVKVDKSTVAITGTTGNVHTNANVALSNNPTVSGKVSACRPAATPPCVGTGSNSGTYVKPGNPATVNPEASVAPIPVPGIDANEWYEKRFNPSYSGSWFDPANPNGAYGANPDPTTYDGLWFDMCSRVGEEYATVQVPASDGQLPCTGTYMTAWNAKQVVRLMPRVSCGGGFEYPTQPGEDDGGLFRGWHAHSDRWHLCHSPGDGIFFVKGGMPVNIDSDHPESAKVTILTDGPITVKGERSFEPAMEDLLFATEQGITIEGGPHQLRGVLSTQTCATLKGDAHLEGAVLAQGTCQTSISDSFKINYDGNMKVPFGGITRITAWNEL